MTTTDTPVLHAAIEAAEAGLAVLFQNGKAAAHTGWNKGPAATVEHLRQTFRSGHNVAFRAGPTSRIDGEALGVLDVDIRSDDEADKMEARTAYAELVGTMKPTVKTGGGGVHLYLRMSADTLPTKPATILRQSSKVIPSDDPSKPGKAAWTIELLAAEHGVTMPPSIHPSGQPYRWLNGGLAHVERAPDSLLAELAKVAQNTSGKSHMVATTAAPIPLPDPLPPVPAFDARLLPDSVRGWCEDAAEGLQVPLDFTAIPAVVALAGAIGRAVGIAMKRHQHWIERPMLWGCVIGRPSSGKSPALSPARGMLERIAADERKTFDAAMREHEARKMLADENRKLAKEAIRSALKKGNRIEAEAAADDAMFGEEPPAEPRILVNDSTVEKLGELLNRNPRGLTLFRDELAGWLASLDREGREGDRAFWLECWNGTGTYTVDRIGRGTVPIEACAMGILGGMQPGKLAEYVRSAMRGGFGDDGLMQRFQLAIYPDLPAGWSYTDRAPNPHAQACAWDAFRNLRSIDPDAIGAERSEWADVPFLRFDDEAQDLLVEWLSGHVPRLRVGEEPPWIESHLMKYQSLVGRLALTLHLADGGSGPVAAETLAKALDWCAYLEGHARRIYAPASDNGLTGAHLILKRRSDLTGPFTAREVYRKGWSGLSDPEAVDEALDVLLEHGHLDTTPSEQGGRPTVLYTWRDAP